MRSSSAIRRRRAAVVAPVLLAFALSAADDASAITRNVAVGGVTTGDCTVQACSSIQYAIYQASSGDTIALAAGRWVGAQPVVRGKDLTITGPETGTASIRTGTTTNASFDDGVGPITATLSVIDATVTIRNLSLSAGSFTPSDPGPKVALGLLDANVTIEGSRIEGTSTPGEATDPGAGIGMFATDDAIGRLTVRGSLIGGNEAGIWVASEHSAVSVHGSALTGNGAAVANESPEPVDAADVWWGANAGPAADALFGPVTTSPRLQLALTPAASAVAEHATASLTASLRANDAGNPTAGDGLPDLPFTVTVAEGLTLKSPSRRSGTVHGGQAAIAVNAGSRGSFATSVTVDEQTATAAVEVRGRPVNVESPVVSGAPTFGSTLTCTTGRWEETPTLATTWSRWGSRSPVLPSGPTHVVDATDAGTTLSCDVAGTDPVGGTTTASRTIVIPMSAAVELYDDDVKKGLRLTKKRTITTPPAVCLSTAACTVRGEITEQRTVRVKDKKRKVVRTTIGRFAPATLAPNADGALRASVSKKVAKALAARGKRSIVVTVTLRTRTAFGLERTTTAKLRLRLR